MTAVTVVVALGLFVSSCLRSNTGSKKAEEAEQENTVAVKKYGDVDAAQIMDCYITQDDATWLGVTKRLGLKPKGEGIMRQADLKMNFFSRGIDYDATTDKFEVAEKDGIAIAVLEHKIDGVSWELLLADKAEYDAAMERMKERKDYKDDAEMMKLYENDADLNFDKIFMKGVYDEKLSKDAGMRLGTAYYIFFEGKRSDCYVISFSHGNGDIEI